jgi:hypothetical protein
LQEQAHRLDLEPGPVDHHVRQRRAVAGTDLTGAGQVHLALTDRATNVHDCTTSRREGDGAVNSPPSNWLMIWVKAWRSAVW